MTAPFSIPPSCQLWIDGIRFADGSLPGEVDSDPVALTDLEVKWGRDNTLDQPEPGTCTFRVLDVAGGAMFTERLKIGAACDVRAEATIYPDPSVPIFTWDAGFETGTPPAAVTGGALSVSTEQHHNGTKSARLDPSGAQMLTVVFPPAPFGGDSAWDAVPRGRAGQTWQFGAAVWLSRTRLARVRPVGFTAPNAGSMFRLDGNDVLADPAATGWQTLTGTVLPPDAVWLGVAVDVVAPRWDDMPTDQTWDGMPAGVRWDDMGLAFVDDVQLLAPPAGALRRSTVFSGRITDLSSSYDLDMGGQVVDVIAQTHLAELNNRYVGDQPWLKESLAERFARIVSLSGQAVDYQIDPAVQGKQITWRDVDNAPSGDLLHQLAQSVAGALWSASSDVARPYIWLEDIDSRPGQFVLAKPGTYVVIVPNTHIDPSDVVVIDACDVLLDPVTWTQTTEDNATRVVVTWQDQTLDTDGQQDPTSRDLTVTDTVAESLTGRRRIQVTTQLATQADALLVAQSILARVSTPGWRLSGITWEMATTDRLDAATLDSVMRLLDGVTKLGIGVRITNLPNWSPVGDTDVALFLEGGSYKNVDGAWILELITSSAISQGKSSVQWDQLPGNTGPTVATRTNRMENPRAVAAGAGNWTTLRDFGAGGAGTYSYGVLTNAPAGAPDVTSYARKKWTAATTAAAGWFVQKNATTRLPATAGRTYTASVYVRHTAGGNRNCVVMFGYVKADGNLVDDWRVGTAVSVPTGTGWVRISATFLAPANTVGVTLVVDPSGAFGVGATFDATALLLEDASTVGTYFDGTTPDAAPIDNAWTGAANASTSTRTDTTPVTTGWRWDDFDPAITWDDLHGVGL